MTIDIQRVYKNMHSSVLSFRTYPPEISLLNSSSSFNSKDGFWMLTLDFNYTSGAKSH